MFLRQNVFNKLVLIHADILTLKISDQSVHWFKSYEQKMLKFYHFCNIESIEIFGTLSSQLLNQMSDWSEILSVKISAWMRASLINMFCCRNNFYYTKLSTRRFSISIPFSFCLNSSFSAMFPKKDLSKRAILKSADCKAIISFSNKSLNFFMTQLLFLIKR